MSIYVICFDSANEKTTLFNKLRALKIQDQHNHEVFKFLDNDLAKKNKETFSDLFKDKKENPINKGDGGVKDGYWLTLQDWSQCSKKCDKGTSTFHRMCIPPKKGGKPCQGEAVITKPCNQHPCPKVTVNGEPLKEKKNTQVLKPIIKIMPFTNHPQRYTLCKIKESDMMIFNDGKDPMKQNDPLFKGKKIDDIGGIRIPSRVVMNTKTISVFAGDEFETLYMSFLLKKTGFHKSKAKNCFDLHETASRYITLCPYGCDTDSKEFNEWEKDFFLFRDQCYRGNSELDDKEKEELEKKIKDNVEKARNQAIQEVNEERKKKKAEGDIKETKVLVQETNTMAMNAIQKETNLEELIKQEAEEKNKREEILLRQQIELENKKRNCVAKAIREKELENQMNEKAKEIKETIKTIKEEAAKQVLNKRKNLRKLIDSINKKAELKRNKLRQQLMQVRMNIASDIGNAYRKGDVAKCTKAMNDPKQRNNYCIARFSDDFAQLNYCREGDDFCEVCCQAEFGEMMSSEKEDCMKKVCKVEKHEEESKPKDDCNKKKEDEIYEPPTAKKDVKDPTNNVDLLKRQVSDNVNVGFIKQNEINI